MPGPMPTRNETNSLEKWGEFIIARDGCCQLCGSEESLLGHHIKPKEVFPELQFDPENGICLCAGCHTKVHKPWLASIAVTTGVARPKEVGEKVSAALLGRCFSEERRQTLSEVQLRLYAGMSLEEKQARTAAARKASPFGDSNFAKEMANRRWGKER